MPKLIQTLDGAVIREYMVDKESISIGRKHGNDIQLNDLTVSGRHALLNKDKRHVYLDDLGSTNGCLLNGSRTARAQLSHGDVIQIGNYQFTYFEDDEQVYEPTMFLQAELEETKVIESNPKPTKHNTGEKLGAVKVLSGPLKDKQLDLKKPFNTLGFNGSKIAMIARNASNYTITAIKQNSKKASVSPALINGNIITETATVIKEGDILELANVQMKFFYIE